LQVLKKSGVTRSPECNSGCAMGSQKRRNGEVTNTAVVGKVDESWSIGHCGVKIRKEKGAHICLVRENGDRFALPTARRLLVLGTATDRLLG